MRRTSSLKRKRSGSTSPSFMSAGSPPTLWCVLIFTDPDAVRGALDDVRVERALAEEVRALDAARLAFEDAHERVADADALRLRVRDLGQLREELLLRLDVDEVDAACAS